MLSWMLSMGLCAVLGWVSYQDWRERAVSAFLFVLLALLGGLRLWEQGFDAMYTGLSLLLLAMQTLLLLLYLRLRSGQWGLFQFLGPGDVLFWCVVALLFSPLWFMLYHLSSLCFAVVLYLLLRKHKEGESAPFLIPLAGFQGLFLILVLLWEQLQAPGVLYHDEVILGWLLAV